jgi:hypothetical protein
MGSIGSLTEGSSVVMQIMKKMELLNEDLVDERSDASYEGVGVDDGTDCQ